MISIQIIFVKERKNRGRAGRVEEEGKGRKKGEEGERGGSRREGEGSAESTEFEC